MPLQAIAKLIRKLCLIVSMFSVNFGETFEPPVFTKSYFSQIWDVNDSSKLLVITWLILVAVAGSYRAQSYEFCPCVRSFFSVDGNAWMLLSHSASKSILNHLFRHQYSRFAFLLDHLVLNLIIYISGAASATASEWYSALAMSLQVGLVKFMISNVWNGTCECCMVDW